jgi:hypothetical protein
VRELRKGGRDIGNTAVENRQVFGHGSNIRRDGRSLDIVMKNLGCRFKKDWRGARGGVELGFMSTTLDKDIALQYSGASCKRGIVFEVNRTAPHSSRTFACFF